MKSFSHRLETAIKRAGVSKGALAQHLGVPASSVSRWLAGSEPRGGKLSKIAKFLGVDAEWLLSGTILSAREVEEMLKDPTFQTAWEAASLESRLGHTERIRRIVCENTVAYNERLLKYKEETREFFMSLEELFELTSEDYPIDSQEDRLKLCHRKALLLAAASGKMYGNLQELILDSLALKDLAETSPATLKILRELRTASEEDG